MTTDAGFRPTVTVGAKSNLTPVLTGMKEHMLKANREIRT